MWQYNQWNGSQSGDVCENASSSWSHAIASEIYVGKLKLIRNVLNSFLTSRMLRSSTCESARSLAHSNCVNFNQAALRAVFKLENIPSSSQATQIPVCVYTSSTLPFIAISNRFSRCLVCSLVSIAIWSYFNRLQNNRAKLFRI